MTLAPSAATAGLQATADGWIHYRTQAIPGATEVTIQGTFDEFGECEVPLDMGLEVGDSALSYDETAHNPDLCASKMLVSNVVNDVEEPENESDSGEVDVPVTEPTTGSEIQATRSSGYYKSYYEDPIQIDVNSVKNSVTWSWGGGIVQAKPVPKTGWQHGWYTKSGWKREEHNQKHNANDARVMSSSFAHFKTPNSA